MLSIKLIYNHTWNVVGRQILQRPAIGQHFAIVENL